MEQTYAKKEENHPKSKLARKLEITPGKNDLTEPLIAKDKTP
jgi:hypothetical protein